MKIEQEILREACDWHTLMQEGDANLEQQQEWKNWLSENPQHQAAWTKVQLLEERMQPMNQLAANHVLRRGVSSRRAILKSVMFGILAVGGAWEVSQWNQMYSMNFKLRTLMAQLQIQKGQSRALVLEDKTELWLNTNTQADLAYSNTERRVQLWLGEVFVQTAKDTVHPSRPMLVSTIHGDMVAKGTGFSVRMEDGQTTLSVFEGAVEVTLKDTQQRQLVESNQQVTFTAVAMDEVVKAQPFRASWINAILAVDDWTLPMTLNELARYHSAKVGFHPHFASKRFVGTYPTNDLEYALQSMAQVMNASLERRGENNWYFERPKRH